MNPKSINRLKVVLVERGVSGKWLAGKLKMNATTVSRWCTNQVQPSLETLARIANLLKVDVRDLLNGPKNKAS